MSMNHHVPEILMKASSLLTYRKVASSRLSQLVAHFQTVYEGEF